MLGAVATQDEVEALLDAAAAAGSLTLTAIPSESTTQRAVANAGGSDEDAAMEVDEESRPQFAAAKDAEAAVRREVRKIPIPPHRMSPLKASWSKM